MHYQLVVFDMAGTVVDEGNRVYKSLQQAIQHVGVETSLAYVLTHGGGKEKRTAIEDILTLLQGDTPDSGLVDDAFTTFKALLKEAYDNQPVKPMQGAEAMFAQLKAHDIRIALNTGYNRATAEKIIQQLDWYEQKTFDVLVTADQVKRGRPHPDMILLAMERVGVDNPQQVIKVGDTGIDIAEGKEAGCGLTVGVTTGAQTLDQISLAEPDHVIDHLHGLGNIMGLEIVV